MLPTNSTDHVKNEYDNLTITRETFFSIYFCICIGVNSCHYYVNIFFNFSSYFRFCNVTVCCSSISITIKVNKFFFEELCAKRISHNQSAVAAQVEPISAIYLNNVAMSISAITRCDAGNTYKCKRFEVGKLTWSTDLFVCVFVFLVLNCKTVAWQYWETLLKKTQHSLLDKFD